jgi:ElaB/YqjD/DUF883 family membrane-anchored ribosome-binding protein
MGQTTTRKAASNREQTTTEQVKETASAAAEEARAGVDDLRRQAGERARDTVDRRSTEVGTQLTSTADAVRQAGSRLREEGSSSAATVVEAVADRAQRLGGYMTEANADRMLGDAESFARRRPWLVAGAAATIGLLASRLLKASSSRRYSAGGDGRPATLGGGLEPSAARALGRGEQGAATG